MHNHGTQSSRRVTAVPGNLLSAVAQWSLLHVLLLLVLGSSQIEAKPFFGKFFESVRPNPVASYLPFYPFKSYSPSLDSNSLGLGSQNKRSSNYYVRPEDEVKQVVTRGSTSNKKLLMRIFKRGGMDQAGPARPKPAWAGPVFNSLVQKGKRGPARLKAGGPFVRNMNFEQLEDALSSLYRDLCMDYAQYLDGEQLVACNEEAEEIGPRRLTVAKRDAEEMAPLVNTH